MHVSLCCEAHAWGKIHVKTLIAILHSLVSKALVSGEVWTGGLGDWVTG